MPLSKALTTKKLHSLLSILLLVPLSLTAQQRQGQEPDQELGKRAQRRLERQQAEEKAARQAESRTTLAPHFRDFLDITQLLMSDAERDVFFELEQPYQKQAYIRAFWRTRDPFPETARNELQDAIEAHVELARSKYDGLDNLKAQVAVLNGAPLREQRIRCDVTRPMEIWYYRDSPLVRAEHYVVFLQVAGKDTLFSPERGLYPVMAASVSLDDSHSASTIAKECSNGDTILKALALAIDLERLIEESPRLRPTSDEWALSFLASTTDMPQGAEQLEGEMTVDYPGRHMSRTVVQAVVSIDRSTVATVSGREGLGETAKFVVDGEVLRGDELFENFRYRFDMPVRTLGERVPIVVERYLRPGVYDLVLRIRDTIGDRYYRERLQIDVPRRARPEREIHSQLALLEEANQEALSDADLDDADFEGELVDPETGISRAQATRLVLHAPDDVLLTGRTRIEATAIGQTPIRRVAFELNGKPLLSKSRPPYSVEIDLGDAPRVHTVTAAALDEEGSVLAKDEIQLNAGPHSFNVRLVSPQRGKGYRRSVRAAAEVNVPEFERLDRLEFYLNDTLVATVYQPPWVQPILIPEDQDLSYVRVAAYLEDGTTVEDVVFVNAPDLIDRIDVDVVELFVSVLDKKGRPVLGLGRDNFIVEEDGVVQQVRRFELMDDLPIHAGILLDLSLSMEDSLEEAEEAALFFFENVLTERDRACLVTFSDAPDLQVPFTRDSEILAGGLAGLVADGNTALYDSIVFTLHYFSGLKGKRALVVLSDGEDDRSQYSFEDVIEYARRTGVAIYPIGLDIDRRLIDVTMKLNTLAKETGGQTFFIDGAHELKRVYGRVHDELRSQYLLAYQSTGVEDGYREIEIKVENKGTVEAKGLRAKTMSGYYP